VFRKNKSQTNGIYTPGKHGVHININMCKQSCRHRHEYGVNISVNIGVNIGINIGVNIGHVYPYE